MNPCKSRWLAITGGLVGEGRSEDFAPDPYTRNVTLLVGLGISPKSASVLAPHVTRLGSTSNVFSSTELGLSRFGS